MPLWIHPLCLSFWLYVFEAAVLFIEIRKIKMIHTLCSLLSVLLGKKPTKRTVRLQYQAIVLFDFTTVM